MTDIRVPIPGSIARRAEVLYEEQVDGTFAERVSIGPISPGGSSTIVYGVFKALANGPDYSTDDIIALRETAPNPAEYFNINTNAVIAQPLVDDLGSITSAATTITLPKASTTTRISLAADTVSVLLVAANSNRKFVFLRNDSTSFAYVSKGTDAVIDDTIELLPNSTIYFDDYFGDVTAIWVTADGVMRISEGT